MIPVRLRRLAVVLAAVFALQSTMLDPSLAAVRSQRGTESEAAPRDVPAAPGESTSTPTVALIDELEAADEGTEVEDLRTETTRTFAGDEGTFTTELFSYPIHYRPEEQADWEPIEVGFEQIEGARPESDLVAESARAPVQVSIGANKRSAGFLVLEADDQTYAISLPAADASQTSLRSPSFDGAQADWTDFLPGVDLRVMATAMGAKTFLILDEVPATPEWTFIIDAPGLRAELAEDGSVALLNDEGEQVARIPAPYAVDSSESDERGGGQMTDQVSLAVRPVGERIELTVRVDPGWLAGATYPVYVDPTVTTLTTGSTTYGDAFVSTKYPTMNFADYVRPDSPFYHEHWLGMDPTDSSNVNKVLLRFDVSAMDDATIDLAKLDVYPYHQYYNAPTATTTWLNRITASWAENTVTENNQPGSSATTSASLVEGSKGYFTITGLVQDWVDGTYSNYGVKLHENGNNGTYWKRLIGAEQGGSNVPHLVVTWHRPVGTPSNPTAAEWTKSRALSWSYSDEDGAGQTHYQVQVDNNSDFSSPTSSSGTVASSSHSWSIPGGVSLTNGTTYYWRVKVKNGTGWSNWSSGASFKWDAAVPSFTSSSVSGAITAADPNYYELGNGSVTITIRGSDANSGIRFTYLRLYNATDEMRVKHDWQTGGTHCDEFETSTLVDATACAESYNSGGTREVTFTVAGLNQNASLDIQWYFTDYAGNTVGYTDTGKNLIFDATAPTGSITSPAASATVGGTVNIVGTASDTNFHQYTLEYGAGASPSSWSAIGTNPRTSPVTNDTLGSWNTSALSVGTYTIRLRVYDKARVSSGYTSVTRTVTVDNAVPVAIIASPTADRLFDQTIPITGTADGDGTFTNYTLHYGVGCASPSTWIPIGSNPYATPVENGTLGSWDTAGLDGPHTLRLVANRSSGGPTTTTVCVQVGSSLGQQPQHRFETWDLGAGDTAAVNVATGNLVLTHPLVGLPYRGGNVLPVTLTYNALAAADVGLGTGWQLDVQARLVVNANGSVTYVAADGSRHLFGDPQTVGLVTTYARPDSLYATLEQDATPNPDAFSLTWRDGQVDTFNEVGSLARLDRSEDRFGNGVDFGYDGGTGLLETITDPASRVVDLAWNGSGQLESVTDWAYIDGSGVVQASASGSRRSYRFFYGGSGQLIGWSDPLNTSGSCPTGGSHLTCLDYTDGLLAEVTKTQTVTTFSSGTLGTTTREITTEIAYADGRVATVTDAEQVEQSGPATTFTWEEPDRVVVARPTTTTAYELTSAADPFARVTSVLRYLDPSTPIEQRTTWDTEFPIEPASVTDNYGAVLSTPARTVTYEYVTASLGLLEKLVEPLTASDDRWTEYSYNANHDLTQVIVSAEGSGTDRTVTRYCYSSAASCPAASGLTLLAEVQGYVDGTGGSGAGLDDADTDVRTDYGYDGNGQRTSVTRHNRDGAGAALDNREDRFTYDANGNLTAEIVNYANGTVTGGDDLTPNATTQARTDLTTAHAYDTAGNRISSADARRAILAATGSPAADDFVTRWTYDALDRQLSEETPTTPGLSSTQAAATSIYDELGQTRTATDFGGLVIATEFDRAGHETRTFEDGSASAAEVVSEASFDADGKPLTAKDRRQVADGIGYAQFAYDGLGRESDVTTATGTADESSTTTDYDGLDRRTVDEVGGQITTYEYDLGGRVVEADNGFTCATSEFDYRDLATETISGLDGGCGSGAEQRTIQHTHDALGRAVYSEVTAGVGDGDVPLDDAYDAVGNRLSAAVNGETPTVSTLNLLDQVVVEARTDGSTAKTTYNPAGNPVDQCSWTAGATVSACLTAGDHPWTNPATQVTSSAYDARNQRVSLEDPAAGSVTTFDPDHNYAVAAVFRDLGSGREHQTLFAYDSRHRVADITYQTCAADANHDCTDTPIDVGSTATEYDANDSRIRVSEDNAAGSSDLFYCYDARNQLAGRNAGSACSSSVTDEAWAYDAAGNRLTATAGASATTNFAYDSDGALCDVETAPTAASCSGGNVVHDSGGRISQLDGWFFGYDAEGRLASACKSSTCASGYDKVTMAYDADGRRSELVTTTAASVTTTTTFRYANGVLAEEAVNGNPVRRYVTDATGAISKLIVLSGVDAGTYLVSWNGHGDALNLLRVNGNGSTTLANSFTYDSWGAPTTTTHNSIGDLGFRYLYVGSYGVAWDNAFGLGLHLMGVRHYRPVLGRFIQPDPARLDSNPYAYASNAPTTRVDPSGLESWKPNWMEQYVCARNPWHCRWWAQDSAFAIAFAKPISGEWHENAIRHCVWQCLLTLHLDHGWAAAWGKFHEEFGNSSALDKKVDYHNNRAGRLLGDQIRSQWWMIGPSEYWATAFCGGAWNRGLLMTVKNGRTYYSDGRRA